MNAVANAVTAPSPDHRLDEILGRQRAAFLRDGPPTLAERRADLKKLKAALLGHRVEIENALDADFGHRSRYETAMIEVMTPVQGIDYLHRNLRRFMRRDELRPDEPCDATFVLV